MPQKNFNDTPLPKPTKKLLDAWNMLAKDCPAYDHRPICRFLGDSLDSMKCNECPYSSKDHVPGRGCPLEYNYDMYNESGDRKLMVNRSEIYKKEHERIHQGQTSYKLDLI